MTFRPRDDPGHLYFITGTILGWRTIFVEPPAHTPYWTLSRFARSG